jgi:glucose/arabinose dehydrogenase
VHVSRSILFGRDGPMWASDRRAASASSDPRRTTIQVFDADGGTPHLRGGLHNAVGLDWDPRTGRLWATDTGQEQLGDDVPPEEINLIEDGKHYGFPFFYGQNVESHVPEIAGAVRTVQASGVAPPVLELPAHSTPLGLTFYTGTSFRRSAGRCTSRSTDRRRVRLRTGTRSSACE